MKKLLGTLVALLFLIGSAQAINPPAQFYVGIADSNDPCSNSSVKTMGDSGNINTATTTAIITSSGGSTNIYVCSLTIASTSATAVMTAQFKRGTGATCGTNTANLTAVWDIHSAATADFDLVIGNGSATIMKTTQSTGENLCVTTTGTTGIDVYTTYVNQ